MNHGKPWWWCHDSCHWNWTSHLHLDGDLTWPARMYAHMYTYICTYYKYIYAHKHLCMYVCMYVCCWERKFHVKELKDLACPHKSGATLNISNWFFTSTFFIVSELLSYNSRALTLPNCDVVLGLNNATHVIGLNGLICEECVGNVNSTSKIKRPCTYL